VADGRFLFAVGAKLGPQPDESSVVIEFSTLYEHVRHGRAIADRVGVEWRVRSDQASGRRVGDANNGVYHQVATPVYGYLQTALGTGLDEPVDGLLDLLLKVVHELFPF
jgi:hypothetical protein